MHEQKAAGIVDRLSLSMCAYYVEYRASRKNFNSLENECNVASVLLQIENLGRSVPTDTFNLSSLETVDTHTNFP